MTKTRIGALKSKIESDTANLAAPLPKDWKPKKGDKFAAQRAFGTWHSAIIRNVNAGNIDIDWQNGWSDGTVGSEKVAPVPSRMHYRKRAITSSSSRRATSKNGSSPPSRRSAVRKSS